MLEVNLERGLELQNSQLRPCLPGRFFGGIVHLLWCARGSISPLQSPFRLAYLAPVPRWQHPALITFGCWLIAAVALVVATGSGLLSLEPCSRNGFAAAMMRCVFVLAFIACAANYLLPTMRDAVYTRRRAVGCRGAAAFVSLALLVGFSWIQSLSIRDLTIANRIPTFWRSVHLFSGVSGLLPQLFLIAGLYCWFWFSLRGITVFGNDRPILSKKADLKLASGTRIMPMFSQREAGKPTEDWALPFGRFYLVLLGGIFLVVNVLGAVLLGGKGPFPGLRKLGEQKFGRYIFTWVALRISLVLADSVQAWAAWSRLRDLLTNLDRLPLRRTQFALQGLSWRSVWAMSGNVLTERYSLVSRQIEAMRHLGNQLELWIPGDSAEARIQERLLGKIRSCQDVKIRSLADCYENLRLTEV